MKWTAAKMEARLLEDLQTFEVAGSLRYLGWKVEDHLVAPRSRRFRDALAVGLRWPWVVLDERPGTTDGLLVVFDPRRDLRGAYGLARKPQGRHLGEFLCYTVALGPALDEIHEAGPGGDPPAFREARARAERRGRAQRSTRRTA